MINFFYNIILFNTNILYNFLPEKDFSEVTEFSYTRTLFCQALVK